MHVGRIYPYADDLWACSAWFWPGFIPRKIYIEFDAVQVSYWAALAGYSGVSDAAVINPDREFAHYRLPPVAGGDFFAVDLTVAYPGPKCGVWYISYAGSLFPSPASAYDRVAAPLTGVTHDTWPYGSPVGGVPYVPPRAFVRPADWSEV